jgi:hypothetical protein
MRQTPYSGVTRALSLCLLLRTIKAYEARELKRDVRSRRTATARLHARLFGSSVQELARGLFQIASTAYKMIEPTTISNHDG